MTFTLAQLVARARRIKARCNRKSRARLPYGPGYKGLALAICNGNRNRARSLFGV